MILRVQYEKSAAHVREMGALAEIAKGEDGLQKETIDTYTTLSDFYQAYFLTAEGKEFVRAVQEITADKKMRILDIGVGRGESSLYLVDQGHSVVPLEPSYDFCEVIDFVSRKFGHDLTIYCSSAEGLQFDAEQFDVVIFNTSFHHCDTPLDALKNAHRLLRPGGQLLLVSEPMLPFFKTLAGMQQALEATPDNFGHYGGNEHSYHYGEYLSMLRQAGFRNLRSSPVARYLSKYALDQAMLSDHRPAGLRKQVKFLYLYFVHLLIRARLTPLLLVLKRLSLVQLSFSAVK